MIKNPLNKLIERLYLKIPNNLAIYDQMTNLYNYNWLHRFGYKKYDNKECFITLIDVNNFKQINDTVGHNTANYILIFITKQLLKLKNIDPCIDVCRFGGDEFIIFSNIDTSIFFVSEDIDIISYGVYHKLKNISTENAISKADSRMYDFKKNNKVTLSSKELHNRIQNIIMSS